LGKGEWYDVRLGKPSEVAGFRSEWYDWFLRDVENYDVKKGIVLYAIGGAGFILKTNQATIYIDPYCGGSLKTVDLGIIYRMIPVLFNPSAVRKIDAAVFTHEDPDHLDENFVFPIAENTKCIFLGPPSVVDLLESWKIPQKRIATINEYEEQKVNDVKIQGLPACDPIPKTANTYIFGAGHIAIFHAGDSLFFEKYAEIGEKHDIDIALISIGKNPVGTKIYNSPSEAVKIAQNLKCKILIPMHWDLWSFSLENPYLVEREIKKKKLKIKTVVLRIGERFTYY
jgi:L-ascorbate 6-phosphate lactonase